MTSLHQQSRFLRGIPEGVPSLLRRNPSLQCIDKSLSSPLASRAMVGPIIGHQDFRGSLQGVHIQDASSIDDADSGAKPSSADHAPKRAPEGRVA